MGTPLKVLCVDDDPDVVESTAQLLELAGCEVRVCADAHAALAVAGAFRPDVCLIDLILPGMDGTELAVQLQQMLSPPPRCIALTGRWDVDAHHETHNVGFESHLVKPVAPDRLVEIVTGGALTSAS